VHRADSVWPHFEDRPFLSAAAFGRAVDGRYTADGRGVEPLRDAHGQNCLYVLLGTTTTTITTTTTTITTTTTLQGSAWGGEFLDAALVVTLFSVAEIVEDLTMESVQETLDKVSVVDHHITSHQKLKYNSFSLYFFILIKFYK
jgi:cation transport ATPase